MTVLEETKAIIAEILGIDSEKINPETSLVTDLQANSLDLLEIVSMLEEKYGLSIVDDNLEDLNSVGDIVNFVEQRVKA
ncbi:MAG: acyl carrier protein [Candidatus Anoxymicrobium japonicum]|uniref:Acyl carrier protein n=1 Tax=Candidatus Anoxymicrobium japonicum TaxID=2013648 RepID=A0A2N3G580_9ACTN|nr:MAG: acyl carrier protein [Candidatus Anoxymicrobium japonicum]